MGRSDPSSSTILQDSTCLFTFKFLSCCWLTTFWSARPFAFRRLKNLSMVLDWPALPLTSHTHSLQFLHLHFTILKVVQYAVHKTSQLWLYHCCAHRAVSSANWLLTRGGLVEGGESGLLDCQVDRSPRPQVGYNWRGGGAT